MRGLKDVLHKVYKVIIKNSDSMFAVSAKDQAAYLAKLGKTNDLIEKSFRQYKCQRWLRKHRFINFIIDIVCIPLIVFYFIKKSDSVNSQNDKNVFLSFGISDSIIPDIVKFKYGNVHTIDSVGECLTVEDYKIIIALIRKYKFNPEFILKCMIKIRIYRWIILSFSPSTIFVSEEYSYTSSFLTYYCHLNGIRHICLMHGEKLYNIRDSYFQFDQFYVWDNFYVSLFEMLHVDTNQFEIAIPPALLLKKGYIKRTDYTYYLADESDSAIKNIINSLIVLKQNGFIVKVRPHPRYTSEAVIARFYHYCIDIEDPLSVSIEESLMTTGNAISLFSTVIHQAVYNDISVVLDDISNNERYLKLQSLNYRFINDKRFKRLSCLLKELS